MDFIFLPEKIKQILKPLVKETLPITIMRTSGDLQGEPGEGYVAAYDDRLFLFSRKMGENEYRLIEAAYEKGIRSLQLRKDRFNSFLDMDSDQGNFSLKFSSFEENDLKPLLEKWENIHSQTQGPALEALSEEQPVQQADTFEEKADKQKLSPAAAMGAALMHLAAVNNEIRQSEDDYIRKACLNNEEVLREGFNFYSNNSFDELLVELATLDRQQCLCILANLMELGMSDGVLHSNEQKCIWKMARAMKLSEDEYETVRSVLLIKNQTSVLF